VTSHTKDEDTTRGIASLAVLAVGYAATAVISVKLFYSGHEAFGLWAANAFAAGYILRGGFRSLAVAFTVVLAASLATNFGLGHAPLTAIHFALANLVSIVAAVLLVSRRFPQHADRMDGARSAMQTLLLAGALAPALGGIVFAAGMSTIDNAPFLPTWWLWMTGDMLGYVTVLPLLLRFSRAALAELAAPSTLLRFVTGLAAVLLAAGAGSTWTNFPFVLLLIPLMVSAAVLPVLGVAMLTAAAVLSVLVTLALGATPTPAMTEAMIAYRFQLSLAIVAMLPLLGSLVLERARLDRRRIAESEQRFRRAMQDSAIGVVIVSLDGQIREANAAFGDMLGYRPNELADRTFAEFTHPDDQMVGLGIMSQVRAGKADTYRFEKRYLRKDGTAVWARVAGSVMRDADTGQPTYLVSQIEDIDVSKTSAAALADAETRWNFALASAGQGVWDLDLKKGQVSYSNTWKQMLGYCDEELDGDPDHWLTLVHPDDRGRVEQADRDHMAGRTPMFEAEFRMRHKDGHWIWILDRGRVVERDEHGAMVRAIGTMTDITQRKQAETRLISYATMLAGEKERLKVTLDSIGDAVICTDAQDYISFMNPVAEKLTCMAVGKALGRPLSEVYRSIDEETGERLSGRGGDARSQHNNRAVLVRGDGSRCSIREVVSPITTEAGEFGGSVIVFQDFTDARTLQRELAYAASHDALTGLANRSSFIQTMETIAAAAKDGETPGQFLFIDLDRFKGVNDTGGHAAGDALLKRVADTIRGLARPGDVVARLGGDEFAAILKSCSADEAETIANRIVAAIGNLEFSWSGRSYQVGASIGVAPLGPAGTEIDEIIARGDEACYSAKASGRNCVAVFSGEPGRRRGREFAVAS
jgi:diguanylate cyclase (GGDEF)-like protein/PAS domain S-box-containing protein